MRNICSAQTPAKNVNKIVDSTKAVTKCIGNTGFYKDITGPFFLIVASVLATMWKRIMQQESTEKQ